MVEKLRRFRGAHLDFRYVVRGAMQTQKKKDLMNSIPPDQLRIKSPDHGTQHPVLFCIGNTAYDIPNCVIVSYSPQTCLDAETNLDFPVLVGTGAVLMFLATFSQTFEQLAFVTVMLMLFFVVFIATVLSQVPVLYLDQVHEVSKQLKWVYENVDAYGGDPEKIIVCGNGIYGHLATLLATNEHFATSHDNAPEFKTRIKGCVAINGIYSDKRLLESKVGTRLLRSSFGTRDHYYDMFPIYNIQETTCPHLLINLENDHVLNKHTLDYHTSLLIKGVFVETCYFKSLQIKAVAAKMKQFIREICS